MTELVKKKRKGKNYCGILWNVKMKGFYQNGEKVEEYEQLTVDEAIEKLKKYM